MAVQAQIRTVLPSEPRDDSTATLPVELDEIPGAVWQAELQSLMPEDMRVSLFERGGHKFALITFPVGQEQRAEAAFKDGLNGANDVSHHAHLAAAQARSAREQTARDQ